MFLFEIELYLAGPLLILIGIGLIGAVAGLFRWYLAIPAIALEALLITFLLSENFAADIYPQIQRQDPNYLPFLYCGMTVALFLPILGIILYFLRSQKWISV